jgi:lysyl-tRNA synthetase class I
MGGLVSQSLMNTVMSSFICQKRTDYKTIKEEYAVFRFICNLCQKIQTIEVFVFRFIC